MQISNIISNLADPATWGKKNETPTVAGENAIKSIQAQTTPNTVTRKTSAEILHKYNVTHITPEDFSQMIQKLYQAGALSEKDYQELAVIRSELEDAGVDANEPINLLEFYSDKVSKAQKELGDTLEEAAGQQRLGPDMRRLDWLQKFATIQANPDSAGLDVAV